MPVKVNPTERDLVSTVARLQARVDTLERASSVRTLPGLGSYFNIRDYGAAGDGVTDDTSAIADAIVAAQAAFAGRGYGFGPTVYFPPGLYIVSSPLEISVGLTFRGDGGQSVIRRKTGVNFGASGVIESGGYGLFAHHAMQLIDLVIDGNYGYYAEYWSNGDPVGGVGSMGVRLDGTATVIENVIIRDCKEFGLQHRRTSASAADEFRPEMSMFNNLRLSTCYAGGIYTSSIDDLWSNIVIGHVEFESAFVPGTVGFWVEGSGNKITNVHVYGDLYGAEMYVHGSGNLMDNCVLESPGPTLARHANTGAGACLYVDGQANFFRGQLYDNTADHSNKIGLLLGGPRGAVASSKFDLLGVTQCDQAAVYMTAGGVGSGNDLSANIVSLSPTAVAVVGTIPDDMIMSVQYLMDADGNEGGPFDGHYHRTPFDQRYEGIGQLAGPVVRDLVTGVFYRLQTTSGVVTAVAI